MVDALPDLVEAIETRSAPTLEQWVESGCGRVQDQRSHTRKATSARPPPRVMTHLGAAPRATHVEGHLHRDQDIIQGRGRIT